MFAIVDIDEYLNVGSDCQVAMLSRDEQMR
jgi:hypothetical protein